MILCFFFFISIFLSFIIFNLLWLHFTCNKSNWKKFKPKGKKSGNIDTRRRRKTTANEIKSIFTLTFITLNYKHFFYTFICVSVICNSVICTIQQVYPNSVHVQRQLSNFCDWNWYILYIYLSVGLTIIVLFSSFIVFWMLSYAIVALCRCMVWIRCRHSTYILYYIMYIHY